MLYERRDAPIFCPVMAFLTLAFAGNSLAIRWKPECMDTPVFRRQVNGVICDSTPWAYSDFNHCLKRFGILAGYPQEPSSYALRRGAANAVDCTVIPGEVKKYPSLLIQPRPTGFGSPKEPDNGSRKG